MKRHFAGFVLILLMLGLCASPVFAQGASGTVKGVCKDAQGNPIADAVVVWANQDNGQKYTLKTNKKGEYFSLGIAPGKYIVTLYKNADDAKAMAEAGADIVVAHLGLTTKGSIGATTAVRLSCLPGVACTAFESTRP